MIMADTDAFKYAIVRQKILDAVRTDLIGPREINEKLKENPSVSYITGILYPTDSPVDEDENYYDVEYTQRNYDADGESVEAAGLEDEQPEEKVKRGFQKPSSMGLSFYVPKNVSSLNALIRWGKYHSEKEEISKDESEKEEVKENGEESGSSENKTDGSAKPKTRTVYQREQVELNVAIDIDKIDNHQRIELEDHKNVYLYIVKMPLKTDYNMFTIYLQNKNETEKGENETEKIMFQTELELSAPDNSSVFAPEYLCRDQQDLEDEYYYKSRPVFARGRGCAASWDKTAELNSNLVKAAFIPDYEISGVSPEIQEMGKAFSMLRMGKTAFNEETYAQLDELVSLYDKWIDKTLTENKSVKPEKANKIMANCKTISSRIKDGINIIKSDSTALKAFQFMNQSMYLQRSISAFSKDSAKGMPCSLGDYMKDGNGKKQDHSNWRPFQIAFVLLNLRSIMDKESPEREIVDLLYFPTGGGKTEAYLGLIAFTVAYRRLTRSEETEYEKDGGVTVLLRYTLRLLTTQQKDRLLKLIIAMDMIRRKDVDFYGKEEISIGFWVGGTVTPNKFSEYDEKDTYKMNNFRWKVSRQVIRCPYCGKKIPKENFEILPKEKTVNIYCADPRCYYSAKHNNKIPVYLVDEEIYAKCPTVVISTVDKFARLPWSEDTGLLFGRTDRICSRCGHVAIGSEEKHNHRASGSFPSSTVTECKPFYPPELIVQDELHLITGPLGTIYGGYETVIEEMCSVVKNDKKVRPKYVVSTATIKNAAEQIKALYARNRYSQFPPNGLDIRDSFFTKEISLPEKNSLLCSTEEISKMIEKGQKPFREYAGICCAGQSVKTTQIRLVAVLLQAAKNLSLQEEYADYVDPYWTLIGYFNSLRELGGAKRLLDDDISHRLFVLKNKYGFQKQRYLEAYHLKEITSRMKSTDITKTLEMLTTEFNKTSTERQDAYDVVIATNMIAVGMDVDRLGLMVVIGQPKQNSEYIQATSRVGRQHPGLIFTVYNPYRPRDLSNYENFTGFHSQMYRYVEGTTATPFATRARDRDLHALVVSLLRLQIPEMADNSGAGKISSQEKEKIEAIKNEILERITKVSSDCRDEAKMEIENFISDWKNIADSNELTYWVPTLKGTKKRLLVSYEEPAAEQEKSTLRSMRDVEQSSTLYYYQEGAQ